MTGKKRKTWKDHKYKSTLQWKNLQIEFNMVTVTLAWKSPYSEFFWSVFSHIRNEYGDLLRKSLYSVQMRENTDQKNPDTATFHAVIVILVNFTMQKVARFMWFVVILKMKAEIKNVMNTSSIYQKLSSLLRENFPDFFSTREPILFMPNVVWWYHWTNPNTDDLISAFQEESF